jgi:DEAD/DEAH box helicase domain-containing protein
MALAEAPIGGVTTPSPTTAAADAASAAGPLPDHDPGPTPPGDTSADVIDLRDHVELLDHAGFDAVLDVLREDGRVVHVERQPPREARYARTREPLQPEVAKQLGVEQLWTHQATAIDLIRDGESVVIATGTASGKSRCYQIPIAEAGPTSTSLMLFPTKALAQDQLRAFASLGFPGIVPGTYDGDSTPEQRQWVRSTANVVLTNPEMLHAALLPGHDRWSTFFSRLQYVVIDELHVLRGVFGTHVSHVLRRLRRLCDHYGASPTFIFTSATIGEPERLATELCGLPVTAVSNDGSPRGERTIALLNPPLLDEAKGLRTSANTEAASVAAQLMREGHRTIVFCRSRKGTELVTGDIDSRMPKGQDGQVRAYRAGYLPGERRQIEHELFNGSLKGVVATSALELGVDVGGLDACVLNGFPGTVASMWQQIGRAGRGQQSSAAVLVAGDDQLDQWIMSHPDELLHRTPETAVINPTNPFILGPHLACAAFEKPIAHTDDAYWGDSLDEGIRDLVLDDTILLKPSGTGTPLAVYAGTGRPSRHIGLRTGSANEIRIANKRGTLIGTVDASRAFSVVHPGAVYLHQGRPYRVVDLDMDDHVATVEDADGLEYTQARTRVDITVVDSDAEAMLGPVGVHLGAVEVTSQVTGFQRREVRSRRILANETLELPPSTLRTRSFWYVIPTSVIERAGVEAAQVPGALHAAEHAGIGMLPLFTICDRWDVGGVSTPWHAGAGGPCIFIYDAHPGGSGIAELGFAEKDRHLAATRDAIRACACTDGCPSCVQSPKCGNGNEPLDKHAAVALLDQILD